MGDFNINLNLASPNVRWNTIIETNSLVQLGAVPTVVTEATSSLLDHIYVSRPDYRPCLSLEKIRENRREDALLATSNIARLVNK